GSPCPLPGGEGSRGLATPGAPPHNAAMNHVYILSTAMLLACTAVASAQSRPAGNALPASEETTADALKTSPRHGEWVDIPLEGGAKLHTWVVYPERKDKAPVVLVI